MNSTQHSRKGGFTLLELIVVTAILGVVMAIGTSAFVGVTRAWNERRALTELDNQARVALDSIREDVNATLASEVSGQSIATASRTVNDDRTYPAGTYADDEITLPITDSAGTHGPIKVAYRVDRTDKAKGATGKLVRTTGALSADAPAGAALDLIEARVQGFNIEYLGRGADAAWSQTWSGPGLPAALRVSIALEHPVRSEFQLSRKEIIPIHVE